MASRNVKEVCDEGLGVGTSGYAVYLDFQEAIQREGFQNVKEKYGNLFEIYEKITNENPYQTPMRIYPAIHYTMGGLWVDYNLMSNIPGLHVLGEANFSDHGANRLGASALMQGLCDGYFVIPYTLGHYIASTPLPKVDTSHPAFAESEAQVRHSMDQLLKIGKKGNKTVLEFYRQLGLLMWDNVGMARNEKGLKDTIQKVKSLREEFWNHVLIPGESNHMNKNLELANRVSDFLELGELMAVDALNRTESCGGHFREESQTPDGEALRDDDNFCYVAAWGYAGKNQNPTLTKENLSFESIHLSQRSYK